MTLPKLPTLMLLAAVGCGASSSQGTDEVPPRAGAGDEAKPGGSGPREGGEATKNLVRFHLVADVERVAAGQELSLGARFDIEPGWHIYWRNPGESGLATEIELAIPEGFRAGEIRYPGPERFESPGGVVSYGYSDFVLLSAPVAAPDPLPESSFEFEAEASWLACREECIQGEASGSVTLPAASPDQPSASSHTEIFAEHRAALPRPLSELEGATEEVRREDGRVTVVLEVPEAEHLEYFPSRGEQTSLTGQFGVRGGERAKIQISYRLDEGSSPGRSGGVLLATTGEDKRYYQLDVPWKE